MTTKRLLKSFVCALTATTLSCLGLLGLQLSAGDTGNVTVEPKRGTAGHYGTWVVTFQLGNQGMVAGGGIRVQLPDTWHAGDRNSANPLQATRPEADHYVTAACSREGVRLKTVVESESHDVLIKDARPSLDGRLERYVFVVRVTIQEGSLQPEDILTVTYGDTSAGSRGMRAPVISTDPEPILLAVDETGSGNHVVSSSQPTLECVSGPPAEMLLTGPSYLVLDEATKLRLSVVDQNANPVNSFRGEVRLHLVQGEGDLPDRVELDGVRGWAEIEFTPRASGVVRVAAEALRKILEARSNPMKVFPTEPERKVYWGDLHSHTHYSWDGVGRGSFDYARRVSMLDFYALTDHSRTSSDDGLTQGLGPHVWEEYTGWTDHFYDPGRFVTLHGYEASFGAPFGHHNVFFRDRPGVLAAPGQVTLPELWKLLAAGKALTIPHHTGKFPNPVRWDVQDAEFRRNFEIYSAHGLSESFDPGHPLAFEQSDFTAPSRSVTGAGFAQDAWIAGLILSTVAASDDHRAQPGKPHWGLSAVRATGLTREEVFDALHERSTYGTSGARILLDFSINDKPMGQSVKVLGFPSLQIEAHGTDRIELLEVLRYCRSDGGFRVIHRVLPDALDLQWEMPDRTIRENSIYYVRLKQVGQIRGRAVMAWSSPIWVEYKKQE